MMKVLIDRLKNGIFTENVIFVQVLAMCPTLAVTTSAINGIGMGVATTVVLMGSNMAISLLRNFIPDEVRLPSFIVIIAGFVTLIDFLLQGFIPSLYASLGIFIPLIVVNCLILGRAEAYASKNGVVPSMFDGLGQGLGFTVALVVIGMIRELLGSGKLFNLQILPASYEPALIMILAPGAFITLGILMALLNLKNSKPKKKKSTQAV
jgi:electron transport complex protein RnfE